MRLLNFQYLEQKFKNYNDLLTKIEDKAESCVSVSPLIDEELFKIGTVDLHHIDVNKGNEEHAIVRLLESLRSGSKHNGDKNGVLEDLPFFNLAKRVSLTSESRLKDYLLASWEIGEVASGTATPSKSAPTASKFIKCCAIMERKNKTKKQKQKQIN